MIPKSPESLTESFRAYEAHQKLENERLMKEGEARRAMAVVDAALLRALATLIESRGVPLEEMGRANEMSRSALKSAIERWTR